MPINYVRYVGDYGEAGLSEWQCLACGAKLVGYHNRRCGDRAWKFCPLCGTKWLGELCRSHERERIREATYWAASRRSGEHKPAMWIIEERERKRFAPEPETVSEWQKVWEITSYAGPVTAAEALKSFREYPDLVWGARKDYKYSDDGKSYARYERRLRLLPASYTPDPYYDRRHRTGEDHEREELREIQEEVRCPQEESAGPG